MLTYVIGDIHGLHMQFAALLTMIDNDAYLERKEEHRIICVGDYIDRGPDSKKVLDLARKMQEERGDKFICLRGNHEQMMLESFSRGEDRISAQNMWISNGGYVTLKSFYPNEDLPGEATVPIDYLQWCFQLPLHYADNFRYYVHAGVMPWEPLDNQTDFAKLWIRDQFLNYEKPLEKYIVHGHTPVIGKGIDIRENRCNVDTGAVFHGGVLSCAIFNDKQVKPIGSLWV